MQRNPLVFFKVPEKIAELEYSGRRARARSCARAWSHFAALRRHLGSFFRVGWDGDGGQAVLGRVMDARTKACSGLV